MNWIVLMNCFYDMVDRRKAFGLISCRDHCQRSSPSRISDTPRAGFEPAQNLSSRFVEWSCAVVITTTPRRQKCYINNYCHTNDLDKICRNLSPALFNDLRPASLTYVLISKDLTIVGCHSKIVKIFIYSLIQY